MLYGTEVPMVVYKHETVGWSVQKQTSKRRQERFWADCYSKFNLHPPLLLILFFLLLLLRWHYSPMWTFSSSQFRFPNNQLFNGGRLSACPTPPTWRFSPPHLSPPRARWPSCTPRHQVPMLITFLTCKGLHWDCSFPRHHTGKPASKFHPHYSSICLSYRNTQMVAYFFQDLCFDSVLYSCY